MKLPESFSGLRFHKVNIAQICSVIPLLHTRITTSLPFIHSSQAARDLYMHFNGRISLLGVEERQLRIKACNAYPPASKHYVKRVLINPGSKYRIKVIPPVLEVLLQPFSIIPNHGS